MRGLLKNSGRQVADSTVMGLLRHGKTVWNEEKRIQGLLDSPLTDEGVRQVRSWGRFLAGLTIDRIICSDLGRVLETVAILMEHLSADLVFETDSGLREQSWGQWQGMTFPEIYSEHRQEMERQISRGWHFRPPGGESRLEVLQRIMAVVQDITVRYQGQQILIVSHEGVVKSLIYHLLDRNFMPDEKKIIGKRQCHLVYGSMNNITAGPLNILPPEN